LFKIEGKDGKIRTGFTESLVGPITVNGATLDKIKFDSFDALFSS
jgi:hypothetical protein